MIKSPSIVKNKCEGCNKFVLTHNKIMNCKTCNKIVHSQCAKNYFKFSPICNGWLCNQCFPEDKQRYNPFTAISYDHHDPIHLDEFQDLLEIEKILKNCDTYDRKKFKHLMSLHNETDQNLTSLFSNIDGNAANFDSFIADITQYQSTFSFIGIAETNIDADLKDLYKLPGYVSEYNDKFQSKLKGSGVGLYIKDNFTHTRIDNLCKCTKNLESLFITITNLTNPITIGVLYRPPSGDKVASIEELEELFLRLPDKNVILLGDYNFNLLDPKSCTSFENSLFSNNMIPVISLPTHERPGSKPSLIDNIMINSTEKLLAAGILESKVSHHSPIFCILDYSTSEGNGGASLSLIHI